MSRGKRGAGARAATCPPVIQRHDDILEPIYEADPNGCPVVHHRVVDTIGRMLRAGNITREMHDAARDFAATFTIARFDPVVCMSLDRLPGSSNPADLTDAQVDARHRIGEAIDTLGGFRQSGRRVRLACRRDAAIDPRVVDAPGLGR